MKIFELARLAIKACETEKLDYMLTGAFATSCYGIPRATRDVDFVVSIKYEDTIEAIISHMKDLVDFSEQVQFDTITWGKRHIGQTKTSPYLKVEFFELFDDPFVMEQFRRKKQMLVPSLKVKTNVPTAEDVIVQQLENLDMNYVRHWCGEHGTIDRLDETLARVPEL